MPETIIERLDRLEQRFRMAVGGLSATKIQIAFDYVNALRGENKRLWDALQASEERNAKLWEEAQK